MARASPLCRRSPTPPPTPSHARTRPMPPAGRGSSTIDCAENVPNSREARELAVYWSFPPAGKPDECGFTRGYFDGSIYDSAFAEELVTAMRIGGDEDGEAAQTDWDPVLATIRALPKTSAGDVSRPRSPMPSRRLQQDIRRQFDHVSEAPLVNFADDLVMFAQRPNVTAGGSREICEAAHRGAPDERDSTPSWSLRKTGAIMKMTAAATTRMRCCWSRSGPP